MSLSLFQASFRARNDNGSETTATWMAAKNTNVSLAANTKVRMRFALTSSVGATFTPDLYYSYNAGAYTALTNSSSYITTTSSSNVTNGTNTTYQLGDTGTWYTGSICVGPSYIAGSLTMGSSSVTEVEFCLLLAAGLSPGDTIALKVYNSATGIATYFYIPIITISGSTPNDTLFFGAS